MKTALLHAAIALSIVGLVACSASDGDSAIGGGSHGGASGGTSGVSGASGGGSSGTGGMPITNEPLLVTGLAVTDVAVFQAVKAPILTAGQPSHPLTVPLLGARDAVFRVYVAPDATWVSRPATAELILTASDGSSQLFAATQTIKITSTDLDVTSVFDIAVPAAAVQPGATWSVRVVAADGVASGPGAQSPARFPADGSSAALDVRVDGAGVDLVLIPFRYNTDGSGRLPDTSDAQLARYRSLLLSVYPLAHINITLRDAVDWNVSETNDGFDFDAFNDRLYDLRQNDHASNEAYYYGLINPDSSFNKFCSNFCTTGQSYVVDNASDGDFRLGGGVGFSGDDAAWTLVHELGHMHGRTHAPCNVSPYDHQYPKSDGTLDVWGYDPRNGSFLEPSSYTDFMGYCPVTWVSAYTYDGLFKRILEVNSLPPFPPPPAAHKAPHRIVRVRSDGSALWGRTITASTSLSGERANVLFRDASGSSLGSVSAPVRHEGHGDTLVVVLPEPPAGARTAIALLPDQREIQLSLP